jgi:predicted dehydrogenase
MIGVAILGYGYWGPKLARNFAALPGVRIISIADPDDTCRATAGRDHPEARIETDPLRAIAVPGVDAVVISTPPTSHFRLALAALEVSKHVLVEKPCGSSSREVRRIAEAAKERGCTLMVDYTFVFAPAVEVLLSIVHGNELGELIYIENVRTNLARFDPSIGVVRDLAVHDFSILDYVFGRCVPNLLSARNRKLRGEPEDFAFLALDYAGVPAHLHVNCVSPVKVRRMTIGGSRGTVIYDDVEPVEKIRLYRKGELALGDARVAYHSGMVVSPPVAPEEPLARVTAHFVKCIDTGERPLTDGDFALRIFSTIEAAEGCNPDTGR